MSYSYRHKVIQCCTDLMFIILSENSFHFVQVLNFRIGLCCDMDTLAFSYACCHVKRKSTIAVQHFFYHRYGTSIWYGNFCTSTDLVYSYLHSDINIGTFSWTAEMLLYVDCAGCWCEDTAFRCIVKLP